MPKFRKKPVEIVAHIWDEKKTTLSMIGCKMMSCSGHEDRPDECTYLRIRTPEGTMRVDLGDYIIEGDGGSFYACKQDIFKSTYDAVL